MYQLNQYQYINGQLLKTQIKSKLWQSNLLYQPQIGTFYGFDHIRLWVGNAKQAADWYCQRFGFKLFAYQGLQTGCRDRVSHAVRSNKIVVVFTSALDSQDSELALHIKKHGDGVRDVAFTVDNSRGIFQKAVKRGAKPFKQPEQIKTEDGVVVLSSVCTYGDTIHTFVQRTDFKGVFLPGFQAVAPQDAVDVFQNFVPTPELNFIDHVVGNQPQGDMQPTAAWYQKMLDFHRFWSVDDKMMHTQYSALKSVVVADFDQVVKMPINEPAKGKRKSQIQQFVDYYAGSGVQHVALNTNDILTTISRMKARGMAFLKVPSAYYKNLRIRLENSPVKVLEDLDKIQELGILIDFDDKGYLLQLFTKPVEDRPTLFFEVIQRRSHEGFGAGNFKSLFEAIEAEQALRGNL